MAKKIKRIYTKEQRAELAQAAGLITITFGTSRGRDTWGYTIVTLRQQGARGQYMEPYPPRRYSCNGGGYDMKGTVLGQFLADFFREGLKKLSSEEFYGLFFWSKSAPGKPYKKHIRYHDGDDIIADGACGWSCMRDILNALGFEIRQVAKSSNREDYELRAL